MLKTLINKITKNPIWDKAIIKLKRILFSEKPFETSSKYWEDRYNVGGNSGAGSYNNLAEFKGEIINSFVSENNIDSVIEFGCGDGNQLRYFSFNSYIGYDVSSKAITLCSDIFKNDGSKQFIKLIDYKPIKADLTLSLDVIYHLIEDDVFHDYMSKLFDSSKRFVIIYSSNGDIPENNNIADHVKDRQFTNWIEQKRPNFKLLKYIPNKYPYNGDGTKTSIADFYIFEKKCNS